MLLLFRSFQDNSSSYQKHSIFMIEIVRAARPLKATTRSLNSYRTVNSGGRQHIVGTLNPVQFTSTAERMRSTGDEFAVA